MFLIFLFAISNDTYLGQHENNLGTVYLADFDRTSSDIRDTSMTPATTSNTVWITIRACCTQMLQAATAVARPSRPGWCSVTSIAPTPIPGLPSSDGTVTDALLKDHNPLQDLSQQVRFSTHPPHRSLYTLASHEIPDAPHCIIKIYQAQR